MVQMKIKGAVKKIVERAAVIVVVPSASSLAELVATKWPGAAVRRAWYLVRPWNFPCRVTLIGKAG